MKEAIWILAVIALMAAPVGAEQKSDLTKSVCVLIDFSESTKNARGDYRKALGSIIDKLVMGDSIYISKITEKSRMEPQPLLEQDFVPEKEPVNEFWRKQERAKMAKKIKEAGDRAQQAMDGKTGLSGKTALLDSLQVAERVFKHYKKDKSVLVIMSDMIEDGRYNFEREDLSEKGISRIMARQKQQDLVPELKGVKVYVVGASVPKGVSPERYDQIERFWLRYLKETGAQMPKENYGSTLMGFRE